MPRTKRAGRKHHARLMLKKYYQQKEFDPTIFKKKEKLKPIIISESRIPLKQKLNILVYKKREEYKLQKIDEPELPNLPPAIAVTIPEDPRIEFYAVLRKAILYYFYGGRVPAEKPLVYPWPSHTTDIKLIKNTVRQTVKDNKIVIIH